MVWYSDTGRGGAGRRAQVIRPGFQTDPDTHWQNNGHKTFYGLGSGGSAAARKATAIAEAQAWASKRYGITEWARDPYGSFGEASFVHSRIAELQAAVAAAADGDITDAP